MPESFNIPITNGRVRVARAFLSNEILGVEIILIVPTKQIKKLNEPYRKIAQDTLYHEVTKNE